MVTDMATRVDVVEQIRGIPVSVPTRLPISEARLAKVLVCAAKRVTDDMTVGEFKKLRAAQGEVVELMVPALVMYMKAAYGVDVPARIGGWHSYTITGTGSWNRGEFIIVETAHDERAPSRTSNRWVVPKSALLKEIRRAADRRFVSINVKDDTRV
mgnify:CR=1 FL=1